MSQKNNVRLDDAYLTIFGALWLFCCIIYPMWYVIEPSNKRLIFFTFLIIYFSINLLIVHKWLHNKLSQFEFKLKIDLHKLSQWKNTILTFIILSAPVIVLHFYTITLPLQGIGDEGYHVNRGFIPYTEGISKIHAMAPSIPLDSMLLVFRLFVFVALGIGLIWLILPERMPQKFVERGMHLKKIIASMFNKKYLLICMLFLIPTLYAYFFVFNSYAELIATSAYGTVDKFDSLGIGLIRYNSLSAILYFFEALLFGYSEAGIRLHSVLFSILSAIYVFRLTGLYRNERTSLFAALIFLYLPEFFRYGNLAHLTTGVVFFVVASSFYFMKYQKSGEFNSLVLTSLFISTGFLYKNNVLLMLPIIWVYLLLSNAKKPSKVLNKASEYLKLTWMSLIPMIPWIYIANQYRWRNFEFVPSNWTHIDLVMSYFNLLPSLVTVLIFILFIMGVVYGIWKKRDGLTLYLLIWFGMIYAFFTSDSYVPIVHGISIGYIKHLSGYVHCVVPFIPVVAIIVAQFVDTLQNKLQIGNKRNIFFIIIIIYLIVSTSMYAHQEFNSGYVPNDEAFQYIQQHVPSDSKIVATIRCCTPYYFYRAKYGLLDNMDIRLLDQKTEKIPPPSDINQLYMYCMDNDFDYLLTTSWPFAKSSIDKGLLEELEALEYENEFTLEKTFSLGENKVMLFKVNRSRNNQSFS